MENERVLFHYMPHDMSTIRLGGLGESIKESETLFLEYNSTSTDRTAALQNAWNSFLNGGELDRSFCIYDPGYIREHLPVGGKVVFERSLLPDFDYSKFEEMVDIAVFAYPFEKACEVAQAFFSIATPYNLAREKDTSEQIASTAGTVTVVFGTGHYPDLNELVAATRPVDVRFHMDKGPSFFMKMEKAYRKTGSVDKKSYLKHAMGMIARKAVSGVVKNPREMDSMASFYSNKLEPLQILDYISYMKTLMPLGVRSDQIFGSFMAKEKLPGIPEVYESIRVPGTRA